MQSRYDQRILMNASFISFLCQLLVGKRAASLFFGYGKDSCPQQPFQQELSDLHPKSHLHILPVESKPFLAPLCLLS